MTATARLTRPDPGRVARTGALAGVALSLAVSLQVLYHVVDVTGNVTWFAVVAFGSLALGVVLAGTVRTRTALSVGTVLLAGGYLAYVLSVPDGLSFLFSIERLAGDVVALITGVSVLELVKADAWALAITPGPVFLTVAFAMRRSYVASVTVASALLGLFVLTGDASSLGTLAGVVGVVLAVALGELDRYGATWPQLDVVAIVVAGIVLTTAVVPLVPTTAAASPYSGGGDPAGDASALGDLTAASNQLDVFGAITLSPQVAFTIQSTSEEYWKAGSYDRYTGRNWVRTGTDRELEGRLRSPPGEGVIVDQRVTAERDIRTMPAAWKPVRVSGFDGVEVTAEGDLKPVGELEPGEGYSVRSHVVSTTTTELAGAGTQYPDRIQSRYLQLPASTPQRVSDFTDQITADAENPYEKAVLVERWLERKKAYSLEVDRPDGDVADAFLFEMNSGYCVYYATTMVTMLRTQGVPARFVVGYTTGQRVDRDTWVIRGYDSHAWVEVYFPDVGWVQFDPTPSGPRLDAERQQLADARAEGREDVDTNRSENGVWTPSPDEDAVIETATGIQDEDRVRAALGTLDGQLAEEANVTVADDAQPGPFESVPVPTREQAGLGLAALVGVVAGARRSRVASRTYRLVWVQWQPRRDPERDITRAFARLEVLFARRYRSRRDTEPVGRYLEALGRVGADPRARRVGEIYERARYGPGVTEADADEAVRLVDALVRERRRRVFRRVR